MELNVINIIKEENNIKKMNLSSEIFNKDFNESLVHQIITSYLSNGRTAIKAEKNRSLVSGGGIKPFRQKGTGKARAGSIRSPLWKGGGKTFTASERRNYKKKINKKMYKYAMKCILSELVRTNRLTIVDGFSMTQPKTKDIIVRLSNLNILSGLLITDNMDKNLYLSSKNIPNFSIKNFNSINPIVLIKNKNVIITIEALKKLEGLLK